MPLEIDSKRIREKHIKIFYTMLKYIDRKMCNVIKLTA